MYEAAATPKVAANERIADITAYYTKHPEIFEVIKASHVMQILFYLVFYNLPKFQLLRTAAALKCRFIPTLFPLTSQKSPVKLPSPSKATTAAAAL